MISIVMAYYNRKQLLLNTIESIKKSVYKDYELIIVDDCSNVENSLKNLKTDINIRLFEMSTKWWTNPCIPFNVGFKQAKGDIIIIQNPECKHVGDLLTYTAENLKEGDYFAYHCESLLPDGSFEEWYNHKEYSPRGLHFCTALYRKDLFEKLSGGFNELFAKGQCFDDDEFVYRVKKNLKLQFIEQPFVQHQWHPKYKDVVNWELWHRNEAIKNNLCP